jgi:hypothetical protein
MKKNVRVLILQLVLTAALLALMTGCATSAANSGIDENGYPAWYLDPHSVYPREQYLAAVGSGDTRSDAEQQAMAGLAQLFKAVVKVDVQTQKLYREVITAQGTLTDEEMEFVNATDIQANEELLNVQFGEAVVDARGMVHTIAYLERFGTGRLYLDIIQKNSSQVQSLLRQSRSTADPVDRYALISAAAAVAAGNEALIDQLRIISSTMLMTASTGYDYPALLQQRAEAASGMRASITFSGNFQDRITGVVAEALTQEGFQISEESPVLLLTGDFTASAVELNPDFKTVRWTLAIEASRPDGTGIVAYSTQGRVSGITEDAAASLAYQDIKKVIDKEFMEELRAFINRHVTE